MSKKNVMAFQQIPGIHLDYRPRSYLWTPDET